MAWLTRRWKWLVLATVALVVCGLLKGGWSGPVGTLAIAQTNAPPPRLAPALPLISGNFEDPQGRFQIGIFEGYRVSTAGGSPVLQAPEGHLAYTVATAPLPAEVVEATQADLVRAAQQTFAQGEGFTTGDVQAIPGGGVRINWTGRLTQGTAPPQPMSGKIFARQRDRAVYLLMVAATPEGEAQLSDAIIALGSTLTVP